MWSGVFVDGHLGRVLCLYICLEFCRFLLIFNCCKLLLLLFATVAAVDADADAVDLTSMFSVLCFPSLSFSHTHFNILGKLGPASNYDELLTF